MWHRRIKSLHGWLGLFVWPWVVMIALTGLYQNHQAALTPWLPGNPMTAERLAALPAHPVTVPPAEMTQPVTVFGHPGWQGAQGGIDAETGATWTSGSYLTVWHDAKGSRIGWRIDWQKLFLHLHRAGWTTDALGTWPADLAAIALTLFGLSGLWLFATPRLRRWRK